MSPSPMNEYLAAMIAERPKSAKDDLLTHLITAEVDGQHLTHDEILGFFQLLIDAPADTIPAHTVNRTVTSQWAGRWILSRLWLRQWLRALGG